MIKIRLQRKGRKKRPFYHIVVADSRAPRDGRVVERLGRFDNVSENQQLVYDEDRVIYWLGVGAKPSETVRSLFKREGLLYKMHLIRWGWEEERIEAALKEWREAKESKSDKVQSRKLQQKELLSAEEKAYKAHLEEKASAAAKAMEEEKKAKVEAEAAAVEEVEAPAAEEASAEQAPAEDVVAETEEAPAEEAPVEEVEAPAAEEAPAEEVAEEEAPVEEVAAEAEEALAEEAPAEVAAETEDAPAEEAEAVAEEIASEDAPAKVSTDMTAGDAISHIKDTPLEELKGFVPESEDRVTVLRAMEAKSE